MPTSPQRLLDEGRPQRDVLAPWRGQQTQREAGAAGAGLEAGLVEQRDRLLLVVGILRRVRTRIEVGGDRGDRAGAELGEIAEEVLDEERHIDRMRNGAANADIRQLLAAEIELDGVGARVAFIALGGDDEALVLAQPCRVGNRRDPVNGLYWMSPASIWAAAAARSVTTFQTMRSR